MKTYIMCESSSGIQYCTLEKGQMLSLIEPLLDQGYCVTTDNFYTSPELYDFLPQHRTDAYGTIRANRRNLPSLYAKGKLKTGEIVAWQKGKMMALRWRDTKDVYPKMRKQQRKYYKKIFRHLVEQCLWNANILPVNHSDFILQVSKSTVKNHQTQWNRPGRRASTVVNPERLTGRHFIDYIPPTQRKAAPTRMCVVCCSKTDDRGRKKRKETRFYCPDCDVGLCAASCFKIYHTQDVY
uniref:PiggyBac transposable element-derived protein 4-like n=1 Tax=Pyxicephalus adspersus TaxID=30357 RepID=A0A499QYJ6_PYXAD|nr:piggyBac transposable element-derived protein 4-like [Pyxicephalus adspersus]